MIKVKSVALFLSRSLLDCTVGAKSAKLKVSTRKWTKHVFASPVCLQTLALLWVMFSGGVFPEHPFEYPCVWVGERSEVGWVTLP